MKKKMIKIISRMWGKEFSISEQVPFSYLLKNCLNIFFSLIRGTVHSFGFGQKLGKLYMGKSVTLRAKNKIYLGRKVRLEQGVYIDALSTEGFHFGDNVKIGSNSKMISGSLSKLGKGLWIGDNCFFSDFSFFGAAGGIKIGNNVISGQNVRFHAENHVFSDINELIMNQGVCHKGIVLGDDIWIGAGAVFLDGSKVGNHCVIAANTVINNEYPDNCVIGGVPGRIIKKL